MNKEQKKSRSKLCPNQSIKKIAKESTFKKWFYFITDHANQEWRKRIKWSKRSPFCKVRILYKQRTNTFVENEHDHSIHTNSLIRILYRKWIKKGYLKYFFYPWKAVLMNVLLVLIKTDAFSKFGKIKYKLFD